MFTRQITLWCDASGCGEYARLDEDTVMAARRSAREEGWVNNRVADFCPSHRHLGVSSRQRAG